MKSDIMFLLPILELAKSSSGTPRSYGAAGTAGIFTPAKKRQRHALPVHIPRPISNFLGKIIKDTVENCQQLKKRRNKDDGKIRNL
jgi:hypothetical protein